MSFVSSHFLANTHTDWPTAVLEPLITRKRGTRSFLYASTRVWNQLSVNHALISPILTRPILWVALAPSVLSTHHSYHPSPIHSFIPGLKPSFSANPSNSSLPFLLDDWLTEYIVFYCLVFFCFPLLVVAFCAVYRLSWLVSAFKRTLN